MIIRFIKENKEYEVAEGAVYTKNYNETLDSATVMIMSINDSNRLDFVEPFDEVVLIEEGFDDIYLCVDTIDEVMFDCSSDEQKYNYNITLFSQTKLLENIICPNLTITPRTPNLSIKDYLQRYLDLYCEKVIVIGGTIRNKWHLSQKVIDRFSQINAPESQWNNPTLREIFNSLMMVDDCIPVLKNGEIDFLDLTETKRDIKDFTNINYIQRSHSSQNYVSELYVDLKNVMQTKVDNILDTTTVVENIPFSASNYILNTENAILKTQFPILRVKKLIMHFYGKWQVQTANGSNNGQSHFRFYASNLCLEAKEWQALKIRSKLDANITDDFTLWKNYNVYYNRGGKSIENFSYITSVWGLLADGTIQLYQTWMQKCVMDALRAQYGIGYISSSISGVDVNQIWFELEYETTGDCLFKAGKQFPVKNQRMVTDNQSFSFVDAYSQGLLEYMKVNRLGNKMLHINQTKRDNNLLLNPIIDLGDKYEDNIVYQVQYQIYKEHIEVNAQATKDYILRDYFTGVQAKIRSWKIADGSEATTRNELIKYYVEFGFVPKLDIRINNLITCNASKLISPFFNYTARPIIYGSLKPFATVSEDSLIQLPGQNETYSSELINRLVGNSIVFTFGAEDNFTWKRGIDRDNTVDADGTISTTAGGVLLEDYPYVNENGEMNNCIIQLTSEIRFDFNYAGIFVGGLSTIPQYTDEQKKQAVEQLARRPIIPESYIQTPFLAINKDFYKDNKEILNLSIQFEFCSENKNIMFTKNFLKRQSLVRTINNSGSLKAYTLNSDSYNFRAEKTPENTNEIYINDVTYQSMNDSPLITQIAFHLGEYDTSMLAHLTIYDYKNLTLYIEKDNELLMMINEPYKNMEVRLKDNGKYEIVLAIYMNLLSNRDVTEYIQ